MGESVIGGVRGASAMAQSLPEYGWIWLNYDVWRGEFKSPGDG
jgi:hypothetical protein